MAAEIRIGSRDSALAAVQTRLIMASVAEAHPELSLRFVTIKTQGDLQPGPPLDAAGKAFFTGALEKALAAGEIDLCVHSLKDMAVNLPSGLPIVAVAKRGDPRDMLILPEDHISGGPVKIGELELSLPVGCSSPRRRIQLLALAPRLEAAPIRGNVPTRLSKLDGGQYGALVLAAAGLARLGISRGKTYVFSAGEMVPAAGQGVLAVQGRRGENYGFLDAVRDPVSEEEVMAERTFIRALDCGCGSPAAVFAQISGGEIRIIAMYSPVETAGAAAPILREEISGERAEAPRLAEKLARRLLRRGNGP
jgi:hydroxymethylbilane synthase